MPAIARSTCMLALAAPGLAWAQPLVPVSRAVEVQPIAVARAARVDGRVEIRGEWIACGGPPARSDAVFNLPVFDALGRTNRPFASPTLGTHGAFGPMSCVGPGGTAIDDGTRWSLGTDYSSPVVVEDLTDIQAAPGAAISEVDVAWLWTPPAPRSCVIVVFPLEEPLIRDPSSGECIERHYFTDTGGGGFAFDFGILPPGGETPYVAFIAHPAMYDMGVLLPWYDDNGNSLPDGSYELIFWDMSDPCDPIPCPTGPAQLLLWGTGDATGESARRGINNPDAYADDSPSDGELTQSECHDFALGRCPDPLAHTVAFCTRSCRADLNHDGFVDGIDADQFANAFETGAVDADLNGDGFADGIDADLFHNAFESAC